MSFSLSVALAVATFLGGNSAPAMQSMPQAQSVKEYVQTYFADEPIMIEIARCESTFQQYDKDGSVHRGVVNDQDVGVMQINEHYHKDIAEKLGLDIYTIQGNVAYAQYLYEKKGTAPWSSSKACWSKTKAAQAALALK
jgi:hypothetical protein